MPNYKVTFTQKVHETCELCARSTSIEEAKSKFLSAELYADGYEVIDSCPDETLESTITITLINED